MLNFRNSKTCIICIIVCVSIVSNCEYDGVIGHVYLNISVVILQMCHVETGNVTD